MGIFQTFAILSNNYITQSKLLLLDEKNEKIEKKTAQTNRKLLFCKMVQIMWSNLNSLLFPSKNKKNDEFKNKIDEKLKTYDKVQAFKLNELIKERPIFNLKIANHFEISHEL